MKNILMFSLLLTNYSFSQNVGIGTTTPLTKLHVAGTTGDLAIFSGGNQLYITLAEGNNYRGYIGSFHGNAEDVDFGTYSTNTTGKLHLVTGSSPRLTVTPGGNIGIGLTNPEQPLSVLGGMVIDQTNLNSGTVNHALRFGSASGETIGSRRTSGINQYGLDFYTQSQNRMTITNSGIVGIGTISPETSTLLDVNSTSKGVTIPRMNKVQREAITNPATGLLVFDLTYKTVFLYDGSGWSPLLPGKLSDLAGGAQTPHDDMTNSRFGTGVGVDQDWSIAGAPYHTSNIGAAYIYRKVNGDWEEFTKLIPDDGLQQFFGGSVSIDYPYAVVGAPGRNNYTGCVYVFFYNGTNWVQVHKFLKPTSAAPFDVFGQSVDIDGSNFVVGCPGADDVFTNAGAVFTYKLAGSTWSYNQALTTTSPALAANANFGTSVAIAHNNIIAGAPKLDVTGHAYYYRLSAGNWLLNQSIHGIPPAGELIIEGFGASVDIHYNPAANPVISVIIGAPDTDYGNAAFSGYIVHNGGAAFVRFGSESLLESASDDQIFLSGDALTDGNTEAYKFGSAVSIHHSGNKPSPVVPFVITCLVSRPIIDNGRGKISLYEVRKPFLPDNNGYGPFVTQMVQKRIHTESSPNALLGTSADLYDPETMIIGAPGKNNYKGIVLFGF